MRRRFGRRRSGAEEARAVDPRALVRISELGLVPAASLDPLGDEDVPASLAALGLGEGDAGRLLVGYTPADATGALLASVALALRLHEQDGFTGRVYAVAPHWSLFARRMLARLGGLPVSLEPVEAPALAEPSPVAPASASQPVVVPVEALLRQPADADQRSLLARVAEALAGLAAKHGGALRGTGDAIELVVLARRIAALRVEGAGVALESFVPRRSVLRVEPDGVSDALDRLEGALRKHLNERRVREGEDGLRGRVLGHLAQAGTLRAVLPWPLGGSDSDELDFVALDADGTPVVGAVRRRLSLTALLAILRAGEAIEPFLPGLLAGAPAPVRMAPPRLWLAAAEVDGATRRVLGRFAGGLLGFEIEQAGSRTPTLRSASWASGAEAGAAVALPPLVASPPESAQGSETRAPEPEARGGRRRRSPRRRPSEPAEEEETPAASVGFEEVSLFDLDDEAGSADRAAGQRRRRRGRGRRSRRPESGGGGEAREGGSEESREAETSAERPARRGGRRRSTSTRVASEPPPQPASEDTDEELVAEEDDGSFVQLAPDAPDLDEPAVVVYDDEEEEAGAAPVRVALPAPEPEAPARPLRRRTALVAHADRESLAAAVLLARDLRQVEGIWTYSQAELMTFFRSVTTDLREDLGICVVGFTPSPAREVIQTASLYRERLSWFDHHDWPPEDLGALREAIGEEGVFHLPGTESSLTAVLGVCNRRSRFSDKLVDLATSRFTHHDYERWGRLWWWRLGEIASRSGEHRAELDSLLAGRPSDLAREASRTDPPPLPAEAEFAARRDFRVVHFGGYTLVVVPVPAGLDLYLAGRIVRDRYGAQLSLAHAEAGNAELLVLGGDDGGAGRRTLNLPAMIDHLAGKFSWVDALSDADHVARLRVHGLTEHPQRFDELVGEIAMGRSILEG
ncbi:MAG: hypothetical protein ABFS46_14725 [Myxococcota bacterium]